ncbi:MAG: LysR family transcriptional regulator [Candidatus Hydrogenedentes bacterium]|nr:LysR family transcriptional regulator [Candidatus Hydrogenedentota bacterium]
MTLESMRCLCAIIETRSFRAAAERLHRSQPAISQQLKGRFTDEPTYRFRIEFSAIAGGGVTNPALWRDYFMKWGIGYVQAIEEPDVEQVREMRMSPSGDNALEFETEFPRDRDSIRPGEYELWMECPCVERAPNPFGWFGTLITPRIEVKIENAGPKEEAE